MSKRQGKKTQGILTTYATGPEEGGIRFCLSCGQEFKEGETWIKRGAPDGSYSVGVHTGCAVKEQAANLLAKAA